MGYLGEAEIKQEELEHFLESAKLLEIKGITNDSVDSEDHPPTWGNNSKEEKVLKVKEERTNKDLDEEFPRIYPTGTEFSRDDVKVTIKEEEFNDKRKYPCGNCDYVTKWRHSLRSHRLKSRCKPAKVLSYQCKQCDRGFTNPATLWRHKNSVHDGVVYRCDECDYNTSWSSNLAIHKKTKHSLLSNSIINEEPLDQSLALD